MRKILFIILDGAAESGRSALSLAFKPNLDSLASRGFCGRWTGPATPKKYNIRSLSEVAILELLGYSWRDSPGRGFLEALGIGLKPRRGSIYFRANFATVDSKMNIIDRRAGRDERGLERLSKKLTMKISGVDVKFYRSTGHRGVLELRGRGLSRYVSDADAGGKKPAAAKALKSTAQARKTAAVLNDFLHMSHEILNRDSINKKRKRPANFVLVRGAGSFRGVDSFRERYGLNACSVSNSGIMHGISRYLGIRAIRAGGYLDIEKNLAEKASIAINALGRYDFVLLHINGADTFAHDRNLKGKTAFIEKTDREVFSRAAALRDTNVVVTSDHETSSKSGEHVFGPVPFLFYNGEESSSIKKFDERRCRHIVRSPMKKILPRD